MRVLVISVLLAGIGLLSMPSVAAKGGKCLLVIDGKTYISGKCEITISEGGSFQIFGLGRYKGYFANVDVDNATAVGHWNEERHANHAHTPLGELRRDGACWKNDRARVCAWK